MTDGRKVSDFTEQELHHILLNTEVGVMNYHVKSLVSEFPQYANEWKKAHVRGWVAESDVERIIGNQ